MSVSDYTRKFERFLSDLHATGKYFCDRQYERWLGQVEEAYREAEASCELPEEESR